MKELENALSKAGWNKDIINCFFQNDPIIPIPISMTDFEIDLEDDQENTLDYPPKADSTSLVFGVK